MRRSGVVIEEVNKPDFCDLLRSSHVAVDKISVIFADVVDRIDRFLSEQPEAAGSGSQAGDGVDEASGDDAETRLRRW
jgi:hypothetical protein